MTLFLLACLLAAFPVVSMKSPIFGPQEVSNVEGNSVSITCFYPPTSVNRHTRKYWCRQGASGRCTTLISSEGYVSSNYVDRANLTNFPGNGTFVVDIAQLSQNDSGRYKCGLGLNNRGLSFDVSLQVSEGPGLLKDTEVYTVDVGRTVTIDCPFKAENTQKKKSLCKQIGEHCIAVIDTNEYVNPQYSGRVSLTIEGTGQSKFSVVITQLKLSDAGLYVCEAGEDSNADKKNIDLQVLEPEPELVYGDLRGSVSFDCALGPEVANVAKFLCRLSKGETCDVVVNTLGVRDSSFEGRILLTPEDENGHFSVLITGLRKEDTGRYLCGAHSDGLPQDGSPIQAWQLFVNEETTIPHSRSVVKGVVGGSVAVLCPYNPKESSSLKYWCRWDGAQNGRCPLLVESQGLVQEEYEGRLALHEEPGNGTYTVILNQLTAQDAGFYWCLTSGDGRWRSTVELKVIEGKPNLKVPEKVTAVLGESLKLPCHFPCKFYSHEKYWCKWSNRGCPALPTQDEGPSQAFVNCDQNSQIISLTLNPVTKADEGWYWCGVKQDQHYGETVAVYVAVEETVQGSSAVSPVSANTAPGEEVVESRVREIEHKAAQDPRLFAEERVVESAGDQADGSRASADTSSSEGQGGSSKLLFSILAPLGLVMALGAVAVGVARARHRKNVDRVSIASYRTNISMSDFENSREFGANDNLGASPVTQETSLEGKDEFDTTTESTMETKEPKKAKRSSKEEAEMAYTAFLLQASNVAAEAQDTPEEV
ncbi:PREDICTED: polymeric immunoglobulin receptor [Propithecus coquereli]|uniref:Polymeric immunoglobulin receptor n=1 Tax=Propithecus coquereli TaxID=379532 RepID=A0A2K6EEC6_PROCO|nr:PREDICTED: polymeric immunoglobulin receptor [Propithecus coquereli]XP_012494306.1 PREDICTED: polymeric immunoglobulin receptor [Propithecus coquereli]